MKTIAAYKTKTNFFFILAKDPLEQFNTSRIFETAKNDAIMPLSQNFLTEPYHFWGAFKDVTTFYVQTYVNFANENVLDVFLNIWIFFVFFIAVVFAIGVLVNFEKKTHSIKTTNTISYFIDLMEQLIKTVMKSNTNLERQEWYLSLYFVFFFIFFCNVFGLLPYSFTLTSSFVVTFFVAGAHFLAINIIGVYKQGWNFFSLFLPTGVPIFIAPFLIIIELVSYVAKVFSLSIRLFANMMSGHALLKILIGFSWTMIVKGGVFYGLSLIPWLLVTIIFFLELLIAFLQAYVFIVLLAIYVNDVFSSH